MTRLSFDVPAVICRWKQKNARRLRRVLWIFATCVPGTAWKRSSPIADEGLSGVGAAARRRPIAVALRLPSPTSPGSSTNTGADSAKWSLTTDSAPFGAKQRHKKKIRNPPVSFEPKMVMRFLPVVAGPRFLADRGSPDGASRRNAGFPPALVASTQEYLSSDRLHKRSR